jgi:hypothetical protein
VEIFQFNAQEVGLQLVAVIVGTLLGEQISGFASDQWMVRGKRGHHPEHRPWLSYLGYLAAIAGVVVFLVCLQAAGRQWDVAPTVGAGIAAAGNQIVISVLITYAVDCYPEKAASIGVFVTLVRQIWGLIGPFWFPLMLFQVWLNGSAGIATALIVGASVITTALLQWKGHAWHWWLRGRSPRKWLSYSGRYLLSDRYPES